MNQAASAARFLFETVLGHDRRSVSHSHGQSPAQTTRAAGRETRLPGCLRLLRAPSAPHALQTIYATGLRVSEACALRVSDIDSAADRMCVRVVAAKGRPTATAC